MEMDVVRGWGGDSSARVIFSGLAPADQSGVSHNHHQK